MLLVERFADQGQELLIVDTDFIGKDFVQEDTPDIGLDEDDGGVEGKGDDTTGRVGADTRQCNEFGGVGRQITAILPHYGLSDLVEPQGTTVIAHTLPLIENFGYRSPSQCLKTGKTLQPTRVTLKNACHLRLLQHDLTDQNLIRRGIVAPRQIATVIVVVVPDDLAKIS